MTHRRLQSKLIELRKQIVGQIEAACSSQMVRKKTYSIDIGGMQLMIDRTDFPEPERYFLTSIGLNENRSDGHQLFLIMANARGTGKLQTVWQEDWDGAISTDDLLNILDAATLETDTE